MSRSLLTTLSVASVLSSCALDWSTPSAQEDASSSSGGSLLDATTPPDSAALPDGTADSSARDAASSADGGSPCPTALTTYYRDLDGDGFGGVMASLSCTLPEGYVEVTGDCDDQLKSAYPGALELCNAIDDDCSPATEDGLASCNGFKCNGIACGTSCNGNEDCVAGLNCVNDVCVGALPNGSLCPGDPYCANHICECSNVDCSEKRCAEARCEDCRFVSDSAECTGSIDGAEHGTCVGASMCKEGTCKVENAGTCAHDTDCLSGSCSPQKLCQAPGGLNASCDSAPDCTALANSTCSMGTCKVENGNACNNDTHCEGGSCLTLCQNPTGLDTSCDSQADCNAATQCVLPGSAKCKLRNGQNCSADGDCRFGACAQGSCAAPGAAGAPCDTPNDCQAYFTCSTSVPRTCVQTTGGGLPGSPCTVDADCASNACDIDGDWECD